jgi:hypothetical protein
MATRSTAPGERQVLSSTVRGASGFASFRRPDLLRRIGLSLVVLALLLQVGLSSVHRSTMTIEQEPPAYARLAALLGDELVLCLTAVMDMPAKAMPHDLPPCPICLALQSGASLAPPGDAFVLIGTRPVLRRVLIGESPVGELALDPTGQPRAPPPTV